ncbi:TrbC/VirB2 family protein [Robbsia andropogonis]|uniref:TrbC/VirB2 family protein n=1 Tax=Robbsia andropogonis TaxID=28092 RepID=UPI0020A0B083|nr:TrbC/VirB2 family protein [Robbsia andropogonis]MCP1121419.1 TrbC/VirB2 family protein [Robbsia andropogonis]MCP1131210.1 TrbC/VirB2 family protein [Robbsia andropogonis]
MLGKLSHLLRRCRFLFGRGELRSTLLALALCALAPMAQAADLSAFSGLNNFICLISSEISGPWLFVIGILLIIIAGVAIAASESTIIKVISTVGVGFGIAVAAIPIVQSHFNLSYTCT